MSFEIDWDDTWNLGIGIDPTLSNPRKSSGILSSSIVRKTIRPYQSDVKYHYISDSKSFSKIRESSTQMKASGWGASVSFSAEYVLESTSKSNQFTIVGMTEVKTGGETIDNISEQLLSEDAKEILEGSPAQFFDVYGKYFVAGYITGGAAVGRYVAQLDSAEELDDMKMKFKAKYSNPVFSTALQHELHTHTESLRSKKETDLEGKVWGATNGAAMTSKEMEGIHKYLVDFPNSLKAGRRRFALIEPWTSLNQVAKILRGNKKFKFFNGTEFVFEEISKEKLALLFLRDRANKLVDENNWVGASQKGIAADVRDSAEHSLSQLQEVLQSDDLIPAELSTEFRNTYFHSDKLTKKLAPVVEGIIRVEWNASLTGSLDGTGDKHGFIDIRSVPASANNFNTVVRKTHKTNAPNDIWDLTIMRTSMGPVKNLKPSFGARGHDNWLRWGEPIDIRKRDTWIDDKSEWSKVEMGSTSGHSMSTWNWLKIRVV